MHHYYSLYIYAPNENDWIRARAPLPSSVQKPQLRKAVTTRGQMRAKLGVEFENTRPGCCSPVIHPPTPFDAYTHARTLTHKHTLTHTQTNTHTCVRARHLPDTYLVVMFVSVYMLYGRTATATRSLTPTHQRVPGPIRRRTASAPPFETALFSPCPRPDPSVRRRSSCCNWIREPAVARVTTGQ